MPILRHARHEKFSQAIAAGRTAGDAYMEAGYECSPHKARGHGHRLRTREDIAARIQELLSQQRGVEEAATRQAVERLALSKEVVARELAGIGFARTGFERDDGRMDLSEVTGGRAVVLQVKRQSLMDLAKLFGWVIDGRGGDDEVRRLEERLRMMTPEQQLEDAKALHERARRALALADQRAKVIDGEATGK
jgi:hypothetical protein